MAKKTHTLLEEKLLFSKELNCNHPSERKTDGFKLCSDCNKKLNDHIDSITGNSIYMPLATIKHIPEPNLSKRPPTFSNQNEEREYALTKAKSLLQHYSSNIQNPSKIHISESGPGIPINYTYSSGKKIILAYIVC